jgi:hypothetical protein
MAKLRRIKVTVEGVTPLLLNRFREQSGKPNSDLTPRDLAEEGLYRDQDGNPTTTVPAWNVYKSIMEAGKYFKDGRSAWSTKEGSRMPGVTWIEDVHNNLQITPEDWEVHDAAVKIPATGGRVIRYRPVFNQWKLDFYMMCDTDFMNLKVLREIVDCAGQRVGVGEWRPDRKGLHGKYVVKCWDVEKE